eukprot:CAMPEP_0180208094 /NCGR_PEP_ID=MMETSP0987-20121128/10546_1 /TAXON_ID=697907 /ORGANISM="non described non described, Strain CCMP2293" /LENGTH=96 /DNA_ID=CAMNT_0022164197 /DNA_START=56 /DNA_END=346 /DNA_ORIENTATION=-
MSVPRWAYRPEAGLSRGGDVGPEAGLSVPRRAYLFRSGPVCPEAGLSVTAYLSRGGPITHTSQVFAASMHPTSARTMCSRAEGPSGVYHPVSGYPS